MAEERMSLEQLILSWFQLHGITNSRVKAAFNITLRANPEASERLLVDAIKDIKITPRLLAARLDAAKFNTTILWREINLDEKSREVKQKAPVITPPTDQTVVVMSDESESAKSADDGTSTTNVAGVAEKEGEKVKDNATTDVAVKDGEVAAEAATEVEADNTAKTEEVKPVEEKNETPTPEVAVVPVSAADKVRAKIGSVWSSINKNKKPAEATNVEQKAAQTDNRVSQAVKAATGKIADTSESIKKRWQTFVIGGIALAFMLGIAYLGPLQSGGRPSFQSTGVPINSVPLIFVFVLLILFPLFFEAIQRGDVSDAVVVFLCLAMSSVASVYEVAWSSVSFSGGRPYGTYVIGSFFLTPYFLLWQAAASNKTRNVFGLKLLSKYDFSPVFNTLLLFWAMAKVHVYWSWLPNPCFFPENFYLFAGIAFLFLELSGNIYNLLIALVTGVMSGYLIFDEKRFWWVFIIYLVVVIYSSTDHATKEITMNVDSKPVGEGGTSFGRDVRTKRLVPYDLLTGALWVTAIAAVVWYGNPSFPIVLPF